VQADSLKESVASCTIRPYVDKDFDGYAETLLKTFPCEDIREARQNVRMAVERIKENEKRSGWLTLKEELWVLC